MDELKLRATEKIGALHVAAKTAADTSKTRVQDVFQQTADAIQRIREAFREIWNHELVWESRQRISAWTRDAVERIKEGTPPLSPLLLYEELVTLFKDRVWRRTLVIFVVGVAAGGSAGLAIGLKMAARAPSGPLVRALHTHPDQSVILVEDAVASVVSRVVSRASYENVTNGTRRQNVVLVEDDSVNGAGPGEVLIRVQAFSVCPVDRWVLRGRGAALRALIARSHVTVGRAFAGVVLDVGHGVSDLELGDEVWGCVSEWSGGAASELLTIRSTRVSKRPRGLSADNAASLPWAGSLALDALDRLRYTPDACKGKRVAICGAASGEGCALVQLLHSWGAHLTVVAPRHSALTLQELGAAEFVDMSPSSHPAPSWLALEQQAGRGGPWDGVVACSGAHVPPAQPHNAAALLKATAPRKAIIELRPRGLISDRLPPPFAFLFGASFYTLRILRWMVGCGTHTDWLEDKYRLREGLATLTQLVDSGCIAPVLDKVYLPQDFESALAHACSDDAVGTTVIRFP